MGIDFTHFGLESSMVCRNLRECMKVCVMVQFHTNKKEREIWEFEIDLRNPFLFAF